MITRKTKDFILINPKTIDKSIDPKKPVVSRFYEPLKNYWLYALKLEKNKYYVGFTSQANPYDRILQHVEATGKGAKWTEQYKPIEVMEVRDVGMTTESQVKALEQNLTWEYMLIYHASNVRGGVVNYPGRILRVGDKVLMGYMFDSFIIAILLIVACSYIILRHIFNWW